MAWTGQFLQNSTHMARTVDDGNSADTLLRLIQLICKSLYEAGIPRAHYRVIYRGKFRIPIHSLFTTRQVFQ